MPEARVEQRRSRVRKVSRARRNAARELREDGALLGGEPRIRLIGGRQVRHQALEDEVRIGGDQRSGRDRVGGGHAPPPHARVRLDVDAAADCARLQPAQGTQRRDHDLEPRG